MTQIVSSAASQPRSTTSRSGSFAAVIPLPRRWLRAKVWAERTHSERIDGNALSRMRLLEKQNRG